MSGILKSTSAITLTKLEAAESAMMRCQQASVPMEHTLHAGMYARTATLAPWVAIVGTLIKIPTVLIVSGSCWMHAEDKWHKIEGYRVMAGAAFRKQAFVARELTRITMIFPTKAATVEEAEAEFTDETEKLLSRRQECRE